MGTASGRFNRTQGVGGAVRIFFFENGPEGRLSHTILIENGDRLGGNLLGSCSSSYFKLQQVPTNLLSLNHSLVASSSCSLIHAMKDLTRIFPLELLTEILGHVSVPDILRCELVRRHPRLCVHSMIH